MKSTFKHAIGSFVVFQIGLTLLISALFWGFGSLDSAKSAAIGGMIQVVATAYFAFKCFQHHGAKRARLIVKAFYQGEALKILLVITMMVAVFKFFNGRRLAIFFNIYCGAV